MSNKSDSVSGYQTQLINNIFSFENADPKQQLALKIYQDNLLMTATRSLSLTYPVLEKMLGSEALVVLSRRLLSRELPLSGDWADWGSCLHEILRQSELQDTYPYLQDIAKLEWQLSIASRYPSMPFMAESLPMLEKSNLNQVFMQLQPSLALLQSRYPIEPMWRAHCDLAAGEVPQAAVLEAIAAEKVSKTYCLVVQTETKPAVYALTEQEYNWMNSITNGLSVAELLDRYPEFDFVQWLASSIEKNWLLRFQ